MLAPLLLTTLFGLSTAQQTILTLPYIGGDADAVDASIVAVGPSATTLALFCPSQTPDCGLFPAQTLVSGPSTFNIDMSDPTPGDDFTATQDCVIASSSAVCKESAAGSEANFPGSSTETYENVGQLTVTVTAGADKLSQTASASASGAQQTSASASVTAAPGSGTATAPSARVSQTGSAATSASGSASASASAPAATGAAVKAAAVGSGFVGVAAGVFGFLL